MHVLDSKITEIEKRIEEVIKYSPTQEGVTIQETILSYGWILLDAWVAWRTLRFLLKGVSTIEKVQEKWLQTPSSYNSSQLGAVWGFKDSTSSYLDASIGRDSKGIFNDLIQKKRNASAHYASKKETDPDTIISGKDRNTLSNVYSGLSTVFLFYETKAFWEDVQALLSKKGYGALQFLFADDTGDSTFDISSFENSLPIFKRNKGYRVHLNDLNGRTCVFTIEKNYCKVGLSTDGIKILHEQVLKDSDDKYYNFLGNKGYYVHINEFIESVESYLTDKVI